MLNVEEALDITNDDGKACLRGRLPDLALSTTGTNRTGVSLDFDR